jgi:hypothetical protein
LSHRLVELPDARVAGQVLPPEDVLQVVCEVGLPGEVLTAIDLKLIRD